MADGAYRFPGMAERARRKYALVIGPIRETARKCGYAVGVHGSLARDIDLIAVPWTRDAVSGNELAERLIRTVERLLGKASKRARWHDRRGRPTEAFFRGHVVAPGTKGTQPKPHGRRCWSIHLGGGPYIDLSVMPRRR
jgi:hypothetical protein